MFKFLHAADIHLDSPLRGLARHEAAPVDIIRNASRRAFINLIDRAIEERVAFVLLAGDIYDGDWKDYSTGIFLSKQIGRLGQHQIRVFAVAGNHDAANRMSKALDSPANMQLLSHRKVESIRLEELGVVIHGRSFPTQHVHDNLAAGFGAAEKGWFNIGLLHTSLNGREGHEPYAPCSVDDLRATGYQYWALGHVHQQEVVAKDPWIVFPGCIQGRHSRETGAKGCVLVTVEGGAVSAVEPVPLDVVRWAVQDLDVSGAAELRDVLEQVRETLAEALDTAAGCTLALRIRLHGATALADALAAYPERLQQQIRALGAEIGGDAVWIERVENHTTGKQDLAAALSADNALAGLLSEILAMPEQPDSIDGLPALLAELRQKLPPEVFAEHSALYLADTQLLRRLVSEAKHLLAGRLLEQGEAV
ncbi:DNA repair exonuclease [Candidatus Thiothrix sp. Deng01]|uniref:DNA repair exonuclease n=1 Tax=Candidatus Thiothrix phosphatis TaxID=3112415 RepID=A0ABU6CV50_9GAMM|nr:DNA repair exonuclease [Candidatus Thiothrix sp. Deng01]MEB4590675.1 DNA repair exonuclease [Candidatus Thiothrix sp. Deng01]